MTEPSAGGRKVEQRRRRGRPAKSDRSEVEIVEWWILDSRSSSGRSHPGARDQKPPMTNPRTEISPEFQRGWDAALMAARFWHESQAKKALIQARRSRFPKNFEREAEVHRRSAEMITTLSPDDV
jgi:hypothetical protein